MSLEPPSQSSHSTSSSPSQDSIATPRSLPTSVSSSEATVANGKGKMKVQTPSQRYVSLLSECGLGYPVWRPSPRRTEAEEEHIINIGDVGIVRDGLPFYTLFNITQPKDSLANRDGVPDGVDPPCIIQPRCITVDDKSDEKDRCYIWPKEAILSEEMQEDLNGSRIFNFTLTNTHGALLLLPQGSVLKNLELKSEFTSRIQCHWRRWYPWAEQRGDLGDQQALYVVTGVEKCPTWAIAAWDSATGSGNISLSLKLTVDGSDGRSSWAYSTSRCKTQSLAKPTPSETGGILNQTVFLRGFWINRHSRSIGGSSPPVPMDFEGDGGDDDENSGGDGDHDDDLRDNGRQQNHFSSSWNSSSHTTSRDSASSFGPGYSRAGGQSRHYLSPDFPQSKIRIANLRGSGSDLITHPCQVINNLAFELISNIDPTLLDAGCVAISHDDDWISIIQDSDEELPSEAEIVRRVSAKLKYVVEGDTIYTSRMSNTDKELVWQSLVSGQNTTTVIPLLIEFRETEFELEDAIRTATNASAAASNSTHSPRIDSGKRKRTVIGDEHLLSFAPSRTPSRLHKEELARLDNLASLSSNGDTDALAKPELVDDIIVAACDNVAPLPSSPPLGPSPIFFMTNDISNVNEPPPAHLTADGSRTHTSDSSETKAHKVESDEFPVTPQSDGKESDFATRASTPKDALTVSHNKNLVHPHSLQGEELLQIKRLLDDQPTANDAKESGESEYTLRKAASHVSLDDLIGSTEHSELADLKSEEPREYNFLSEQPQKTAAQAPLPQRGQKKRRLRSACDTCKKRLACIHSDPSNKRSPKRSYAGYLEERVRILEDIIQKTIHHNLDDLKQKGFAGAVGPHNMFDSIGSSPSADPADEESDEDDFAHIGLSEQFRKMTFKEDTIAQSFFGPSSEFMLLKRAHASKTEYTGHESIHNKELKREDYWRIHS
ncbi:hypothetical protein V5O48_018197, partial [Marasmius crinis-equi]